MSDNVWPVQYWSSSKGAYQNIAEMPTPHLRNAEKKLAAVVTYYQEDIGGPDAIHQVQPQGNLEVLEALRAELKWREENEVKPAAAPQEAPDADVEF